MKLIKQVKVDDGELGGFINVAMNSMFIFTLVNSVGIYALFFDKFLSKYISLSTGIIAIIISILIWWIVYYSIIYPSVIRYGNRQAWKHGNPYKVEFDLINERLDKIEQMIKELHKNEL